jgi:hypothetical protein
MEAWPGFVAVEIQWNLVDEHAIENDNAKIWKIMPKCSSSSKALVWSCLFGKSLVTAFHCFLILALAVYISRPGLLRQFPVIVAQKAPINTEWYAPASVHSEWICFGRDTKWVATYSNPQLGYPSCGLKPLLFSMPTGVHTQVGLRADQISYPLNILDWKHSVGIS